MRRGVVARWQQCRGRYRGLPTVPRRVRARAARPRRSRRTPTPACIALIELCAQALLPDSTRLLTPRAPRLGSSEDIIVAASSPPRHPPAGGPSRFVSCGVPGRQRDQFNFCAVFAFWSPSFSGAKKPEKRKKTGFWKPDHCPGTCGRVGVFGRDQHARRAPFFRGANADMGRRRERGP